jgi:hypothetical protein
MARAVASSGRISLSDLVAYAADRKQTAGDVFENEWINQQQLFEKVAKG